MTKVPINKSSNFLLEIVDAIGHITFITQNYALLNDLLLLFDYSENQDVLRWKIIRGFQSFPDSSVVDRLKNIFEESDIPCHRWEAVRSLGIINNDVAKTIIQKALNDQDPKVVKMAKRVLNW